MSTGYNNSVRSSLPIWITWSERELPIQQFTIGVQRAFHISAGGMTLKSGWWGFDNVTVPLLRWREWNEQEGYLQGARINWRKGIVGLCIWGPEWKNMSTDFFCNFPALLSTQRTLELKNKHGHQPKRVKKQLKNNSTALDYEI